MSLVVFTCALHHDVIYKERLKKETLQKQKARAPHDYSLKRKILKKEMGSLIVPLALQSSKEIKQERFKIERAGKDGFIWIGRRLSDDPL